MIQRKNCPVCDKPLPEDPQEYRRMFPFCSARCRQIDLYRWSAGRYAIVETVDREVIELLQTDPDVEVQLDSDGLD